MNTLLLVISLKLIMHEILDLPNEDLEEEDGEYEIAGHWRRLGNYLIDLLVAIIVQRILLIIIYSPLIIFPGWIGAYLVFLLPCIYLGYCFTFEMFLGRTLGKIITGTIVVRKDGYNPSFINILLRTITRIIPFDILSFLTRNAIGWHDLMSGTRVVRKLNNS